MSKRLIDLIFGLGGRRAGAIYIVDESTDDSHIKVGYTKWPGSRMAILQTGNPRRLRVLLTERAPPQAEKLIHDALAQARVINEWFARTPDVQRFLDVAVRSGLRAALHALAEDGGELDWPKPPPPPTPPGVSSRRAQREIWHKHNAETVERILNSRAGASACVSDVLP